MCAIGSREVCLHAFVRYYCVLVSVLVVCERLLHFEFVNQIPGLLTYVEFII